MRFSGFQVFRYVIHWLFIAVSWYIGCLLCCYAYITLFGLRINRPKDLLMEYIQLQMSEASNAQLKTLVACGLSARTEALKT